MIYTRLEAHRYELITRRYVIEFAPSQAPLRILAAACRDPNFPVWFRKRLDVDLVPARLVGLVCNPVRARFRRKARKRLVEWRSQVWSGLQVSFSERQNPQVSIRIRRGFVIEQQSAVAGPVGC